MKNLFLFLIIFANIFLNCSGMVGMTLTDTSGRKIDVKILKIETNRINIQLHNGTDTWVNEISFPMKAKTDQ